MELKICSSCKKEQELSNFHKNKRTCKTCRKVERKQSYEKRKNKDYNSILEYNNSWRNKNPEKMAKSRLKWQQTHREHSRLLCNTRYTKAKKARVIWADKIKIKSIYEQAQNLNLEVDHIIPLNSKLVCGLHNEFNLQLLTRQENSKKGNSFIS